MRRPSHLLVTIVGMALIAISCTTDTSISGTTENGVERGDTSAMLLDSEFPVDDLLVQLFGTKDLDIYLAEQQRSIGDLVQVCMQDEGFEYRLPTELQLEIDYTDRTTREFAAADGFGVTSDFIRLFVQTNGQAFQTQDVNQPYLASLTSQQVADFVVALDGPTAEPGQIQTDTGCRGRSSDIVRATWAEFNESLPQFSALTEEVDAHPGMTDIRSTWSSCMLDQGFEYLDLDDVERDVTRRLEELFASAFSTGVSVVSTDAGLAFAPETQAILEDIAEFERSVAVSNWDCRDRVRFEIDAVNSEVQRSFVDTHRSTIDELLAS